MPTASSSTRRSSRRWWRHSSASRRFRCPRATSPRPPPPASSRPPCTACASSPSSSGISSASGVSGARAGSTASAPATRVSVERARARAGRRGPRARRAGGRRARRRARAPRGGDPRARGRSRGRAGAGRRRAAGAGARRAAPHLAARAGRRRRRHLRPRHGCGRRHPSRGAAHPRARPRLLHPGRVEPGPRQRRAGHAAADARVALLWLDMNVLMPHFRGERYPHLVKRYAYLGETLPEVLASVVVRPWRWARVVFTPEKALYLLALLAPLGLLPLAALGAAAAALPGLAVNLLSTDAFLFHHRTPYRAFVLPFLMLAAVEGFATLRAAAWWPRRIPRVAPLVAAGVVAVVLASRTVNELGVSKWALGPEQRAAHALMTRVPPLIPVSVNERLVPHLATRAECYIF